MFIILYPENVFIMFTKFRKIVEDGRLARVLEATNSNHNEICIICQEVSNAITKDMVFINEF